MKFEQIVQATEQLAQEAPQHVSALLYILLSSEKVGLAMAAERVPSVDDLLALVRSSGDKAPLGTVGELIAEFHETTRAVQARAPMPVLPIVE